MSIRLRLATWLLAAVALTPQGAGARPSRAAPLAEPAARAAVDWRPVELTPVTLGEGPAWAAEPDPGASPARAVVVGPGKGALVRLGSVVALQVRAEPGAGGRPAALRFWRRTGAAGAGRAAVAEPGVEVAPGTWLIEQPPGGPGEWLISASAPTRISALTPVPRAGELIWEHVAGAVLDWIATSGPPPTLPDAPAMAALHRELLADAAIAAALQKSDPKDMSLQEAVRAWRSAAALQRIAALRAPTRPGFALETAPRALAGATPTDIDGRVYQRVVGGKTWELRLLGPGVAWISARLLGQDPNASITVTSAGRRLARARLDVASPCPPDAPACREGGRERALAVPLAPGERTYQIRLEGEGALLQIRAGRTLERFAAAVRRESVPELLRAGRRALSRSDSPRARLVEALFARVEGRPLVALDRPADPALALTRDWLRAEDDGLDPARRRDLASALVRAAETCRDPDLAARARAAAVDMVAETGDAALARRLLGARPGEAPAQAVAALAPLLDGPALPLASPTLAVLERARRRAPHDPELRAAYRDHWWSTRWSALHAEPGAPALQWIERLAPDPERPTTAASLWTWPNKQVQTVTAPELAAAPGRPALLRLYAHGDAGVTLTVDDRRWRTVPLTRIEPIEVALPAGAHALEIAAPPGVDVWSSLPPVPARAPDARLLRMWTAGPDRPVRFALSGEPTFARLEVRALDRDAPTRVDLSLTTDTGLRREVAVELGPADFAAVPLAGGPRVGPATAVLVPLDLRTRALEVRVTAGGPRVAVSASVRAPGRADAASAALAAAPQDSLSGHVHEDIEDPLAVVERASRALLARPHDPELLLDRAAALLDLDQRPYALSDWARIAARPLPARLHPRAVALGARIEALAAPSHVDVTTDAPVLVAPALAAADLDELALARLAPVTARARADGPVAALAALDSARASIDLSPGTPVGPAAGARETSPKGARETSPRDVKHDPKNLSKQSLSREPAGPVDPAALAVRAALLDAAGRPAEAFRAWHRLYAETGRWQVGLAGVKSALAALDAPTTAPDGAGLAYGLALRVRPSIRTPALARLTAIAGERSRWSHLILSEAGGSREQVTLPPTPAPPTVAADVRLALLAPPFPAAGALVLQPGLPVLFDLARGHRELDFDLWCSEVRPELGGAAPTVRFWMGEELLHAETVAAAAATEVHFAVPARDAVTLELDDASHAWLCAARLRRPDARAPATANRWHVARPKRPLEFIVLGPTTVQIEVHGRPASDVRVAIARGAGPFGPARPLGGPQGQVRSGMSSKTTEVAPPVQILTLADSGPLRMRLAPGVGPARIRVHQRLDAEAAPAPARPPRRSGRLADAAPLPPPAGRDEAAPGGMAVAAARRVQRFGTPYADFHMGTDDLEDSDDLRPRLSGIVRLGYARELLSRRLWLEVNPELRPREDTALVAGGRLGLQAFFPRAGLRAWVSGLGLVQTEQPLTPWSLRFEGRLDRPTWLAPRLQLLPGLDLAYRHQSLDRGHGFAPGELHPRVYQWYVEDHPLVFRPTLDLRVVAWQDARVVVGADMMPNSDFRSVDQVSAHVGMAGALALHRRIVPEFALDYEASVRIKDDDRAQTYLRSRILAGAGLAFWPSDAVRIAFGVRNNLYLSAPYPARNALDLWLRIDLPLGRGLRDFGPLEMPFRAAREHRLWRQEPTP